MKNANNRENKKKKNIYRRALYYFDIWLSKGTLSTILFLITFTAVLVFIIGLLAVLFGGQESLAQSLWNTMNHAFDPGVLSGDTGSRVFLFLMLLATLVGVFFLAMLIGLINDGIQSRVSELSKGIEAVVESDHVVILGFNESTFIIIAELIEAYRNQGGRRNAVVIMDQLPKEEMDDRIRIEFPDTGNLVIVCRSGSICSNKDLHRCSIETCKSIIIAANHDFETIKSILACTKILNEAGETNAYITSVIYGRENEHAARIAGNDASEDEDLFSVKNDRLELLMMENTVSKIMTHTCRQNGLSQVFTELFNFSGHEFYIARPEKNEKLYEKVCGMTIRQINRCLDNTTAIGIIQKDGSVLIADPNTVVLEEGCKLLLFQEDDDTVIPIEEKTVNYTPPTERYIPEPLSILIIGCNEKLPYILREMSNYLTPGTIVYLASDPEDLDHWLTDDIIEDMLAKNIDSAVKVQRKDTLQQDGAKKRKKETRIDDHKYIYGLLTETRPQYVLTLSPDKLQDDEADEKALKLLLYCKNYKNMHPEAEFGVTCEMRSIENQQLAEGTMASDFVISRSIASLMMSQIAENRELREVFENLLCNEGFEVYMKPAKYYMDLRGGKPIDLFSVQDAVAEKGEILIGYKKKSQNRDTSDGAEPLIVLNPARLQNGAAAEVSFSEEDEFIVLSEDMNIRA
ncbi:MAG: hypothetical protein IJ198_13915 [Lachnospiraceae bacterium]|nr:hypothetical protein [Lachnospiraceae bacterium]